MEAFAGMRIIHHIHTTVYWEGRVGVLNGRYNLGCAGVEFMKWIFKRRYNLGCGLGSGYSI